MQIVEIKNNIEKILDNNKAGNITTINLKNKSYIADYMIIASGTSSRHLQSLSEILVMELKKIPTKPNSIDINFPDKYSFCIIDTNNLKINFKKLVNNFYNDTYLYDQNACSSPHLVLWYGKQTKKFKLD